MAQQQIQPIVRQPGLPDLQQIIMVPIFLPYFAFFTCFSEIYQQAISFIQVPRFQSQRTLATASPRSPYGPYHISTAIVLNRSPILTCTPTQFEQAYYAY
jgi:hypothetical protein